MLGCGVAGSTWPISALASLTIAAPSMAAPRSASSAYSASPSATSSRSMASASTDGDAGSLVDLFTSPWVLALLVVAALGSAGLILLLAGGRGRLEQAA